MFRRISERRLGAFGAHMLFALLLPAGQLLAQEDVDGALVGGASLNPESFAAICRAAIHS